MDPLSIAASAITIVGAINTTSKLAVKFKHGPTFVRNLEAEFRELHAVATYIYLVLSEHSHTTTDFDVLSQPLTRLITAQTLFNDRLKEIQTHNTRTRIFRRTKLMFNYKKLSHLTLELAAVRSSFNTAIALLSFRACLTKAYAFEISPSFLPEQYGTLVEYLVLFSTVALRRTSTTCTYKLFLLLAQTTRQWRWISITITTPLSIRDTTFNFEEATKVGISWLHLPYRLRKQLKSLVRSHEHLLATESPSLELQFVASEKQECAVDLGSITIPHADKCERNKSDNALIQHILSSYPQHYVESQVAVLKRLPRGHMVGIGPRQYVEMRLPPLTAGGSDRDLVAEYTEQLRSFLAAQGCPYVAKYAGLVLSEDRTQLHGYLADVPERGSLGLYLDVMNLNHTPVPWTTREKWIKQLCTAVASLHGRGIVIGDVSISRIFLDSKEDIVIPNFRSSAADVDDWPGAVPPEYRQTSKAEFSLAPLTPESDIFRMGLVIWLLTENLSSILGVMCPRAACTSPLRSRCQEHRNPTTLPPCQSHAPSYINEIIMRCRQDDPAFRSSAQKLLDLVPNKADIAPSTPLQLPAFDISWSRLICNECGQLCLTEHYGCAICRKSNWYFTLCTVCYIAGVPCLDDSHCMQRRPHKRGQYINL